jgi:hypothetical protein
MIVHQEKADRVIFVGDYFDSFDIPALDQMYNFNEIISYKNSGQSEVILLIGNHDYHYYPEVGHQGISGYQYGAATAINKIIMDNRVHLQMSYKMGDFLFSHAGVSSVFMDKAFGTTGWTVDTMADDLNELFTYQPLKFNFGTYCDADRILDPYGDNVQQSPIWIRPRSLMSANYDTLRKKVIQVFGHTQIKKIDTKGGATGGRYYDIDCLDTSGEYMIINDGEISFNTWR